MKGDFSRRTFDPTKHYSAVLDQQGRVRLDAELNELGDIVGHRVETETVDVVGGCGAPKHDAGFAITTDGTTLTIGKGRCYVDGILCESETDLDYKVQPDFPSPPDPLTALAGGSGIVYLDVWRRHITALDDPRLREVALGGPDSTSRIKTVWQVRVLPLAGTGGGAAPGCGDTFPEWDALVAPPTGSLNARTTPTTASDDPCLLPPGAGYLRLENQLYRVEIHTPGAVGTATFKWSRDNGSVVTAIEQVSGQTITVHDTGPDDVLGFHNGDWVELSDDSFELSGNPGGLLQITNVDAATRVIKLSGAPPGLNMGLHPKLRRWDSAGATTVTIPGTNGGWLPLESGIEVLFGNGTYETGDYWLIPARTAKADIEWPPFAWPNVAPVAQAREGIVHHYCRLATVQVSNGKLQVTNDCRLQFPPLTEVGTAPPAPPSIKVTNTSWRNDDILSLAEFVGKGLVITLNGAPWAHSTGAPILDPAVLTVALEAPYLTEPFATGGASVRLGIVGTSGLTTANVSGITTATVSWKAGDPMSLRVQVETLLRRTKTLRVRVTLSGHVVWSADQGTNAYLDGRALGQPGTRMDGSPRTALLFPSGTGTRGTDFESWFYLAAEAPPAPPLQVQSVAFVKGEQVLGKVLVTGGKPLPKFEVPSSVAAVATGVLITFTRAILKSSVTPGSVLVEGPPGTQFQGTPTVPDPQRVLLTVKGVRVGVQIFQPLMGFTLRVKGTTPAIQAADDQTPLDGDFNGQPGGDFAFSFTIENVIM